MIGSLGWLIVRTRYLGEASQRCSWRAWYLAGQDCRNEKKKYLGEASQRCLWRAWYLAGQDCRNEKKSSISGAGCCGVDNLKNSTGTAKFVCSLWQETDCRVVIKCTGVEPLPNKANEKHNVTHPRFVWSWVAQNSGPSSLSWSWDHLTRARVYMYQCSIVWVQWTFRSLLHIHRRLIYKVNTVPRYLPHILASSESTRSDCCISSNFPTVWWTTQQPWQSCWNDSRLGSLRCIHSRTTWTAPHPVCGTVWKLLAPGKRSQWKQLTRSNPLFGTCRERITRNMTRIKTLQLPYLYWHISVRAMYCTVRKKNKIFPFSGSLPAQESLSAKHRWRKVKTQGKYAGILDSLFKDLRHFHSESPFGNTHMFLFLLDLSSLDDSLEFPRSWQIKLQAENVDDLPLFVVRVSSTCKCADRSWMMCEWWPVTSFVLDNRSRGVRLEQRITPHARESTLTRQSTEVSNDSQFFSSCLNLIKQKDKNQQL